MVDDAKPFVDTKNRLKPRMKEVVRKDVICMLDTCIIYPISYSKQASPTHCTFREGCVTIINNDKDELIPTRTIAGRKMCIDFRKLNKETMKSHNQIPLMECILERISSNSYFCFLDGYSGYSLAIQPKDPEKTTFTCPYGTYDYRLMPFG